MTVAITGVGTVSSLGILTTLPPTPLPMFAHTDLDEVRAGLPKRGIGFLNPATLLALRATTEAVREAGHSPGLPVPAGLVVGTCRPHHQSITDQFRSFAETNEVRLILGLNGGINTVAARLAIRFRTQAFSYTVPSDSVGGLDAILEGARMVVAGRAAAVLAGGVEASSTTDEEAADGAAFVVLEPADKVRESGRCLRGVLIGWAATGAPTADGELRHRWGVAVVRKAVTTAGSDITRALLSGGPGEEDVVADALGPAAPPRGRLCIETHRLGALTGAFQVASALSSDHDEVTLLVNFARGKMLAAVVRSAKGSTNN